MQNGNGTKTCTGTHFHNYFDSFEVMRRKYSKTYGHPKKDAEEISLGTTQEDIKLGVRSLCIKIKCTELHVIERWSI